MSISRSGSRIFGGGNALNALNALKALIALI
jgi:hypothetical protein